MLGSKSAARNNEDASGGGKGSSIDSRASDSSALAISGKRRKADESKN